MILNSIRWQIQLWHGALLAAAVAGLTIGFYHFERSARLREVDRELQTLLTPILPRVAPPPNLPRRAEPGEPRGETRRGERWPLEDAAGRMVPYSDRVESGQFYYVVWTSEREIATQSAGAPAAVPYPERSEVSAENPMRARDGFRELVHLIPSGTTVLIGTSTANIEKELSRLAWQLAAAGAGVLALGLAGGWWMAGRAIRPIAAISAAADEIARGKHGHRIDVAETRSELGRLGGVLNHTFDELEKSIEQQRRFTSDAAHELRTPVTVILTHTQSALARERAPEEYRESLEACQRAAQRMRRLIKTLLQLARLDAGHDALKREPLDLAVTLRDCVEMIRPLAEHHGLKLHCEVPELKCTADGERLAQVFMNLLSNAVQYNRAGGEIRITGARQNGSVTVTVADTGPGIPAGDLPHVFERFYRGDKSRTGGTGHAGLGLSICKAVVDAHGGELTAAGQPGAGATFTVRLPGGEMPNHGAH
ncbi:MAG: HAMP domain-containing protein [Verrucomicrobia bacterium]|nr:HAMP domain-containing protein [Verrucomicrobiota bacterium]